MSNDSLNHAKSAKNDEYYTLMENIKSELSHYTNHFENAIIYCNCDNPHESKFVQYFKENFVWLKLKKLIASCYVENGHGRLYELSSDSSIERELVGDGSFDSPELLPYLEEADIVVSNPPFSIARQRYIPYLYEHNKKYIIVGDISWIAYNNVFPFYNDGNMFFGYTKIKKFVQPDGTLATFGNKCWYENVVRHYAQPLNLTCEYSEHVYEHYDNYDAIESKTAKIPRNYDGKIGVPISFIEKHNPEQFEVLWIDNSKKLQLHGKSLYTRVIIQKVKGN